MCGYPNVADGFISRRRTFWMGSNDCCGKAKVVFGSCTGTTRSHEFLVLFHSDAGFLQQFLEDTSHEAMGSGLQLYRHNYKEISPQFG